MAQVVCPGEVTGDPDGQAREGQTDEGEDPEGGDLLPEVRLPALAPDPAAVERIGRDRGHHVGHDVGRHLRHDVEDAERQQQGDLRDHRRDHRDAGVLNELHAGRVHDHLADLGVQRLVRGPDVGERWVAAVISHRSPAR